MRRIDDVAYRQIFPSNFPPVPSLRLKLIRVRTPDILPAVHNVHRKIARRALWDEDGRVPVFAPAAGERGVFVGVTGVYGHDGVDAERFVVDVSEIFAVLQFREGDLGGLVVGAEVLKDGVAQLLVARRVAGEVVED